jgi:hypothetical protein
MRVFEGQLCAVVVWTPEDSQRGVIGAHRGVIEYVTTRRLSPLELHAQSLLVLS